MKAAILCPGPSLRKTLPKDFAAYDRVIAVTCAVFADAPFSAWSFQEGPGHPHQERYLRYYARLRELDLDVWCVKKSGNRWRDIWKIPEEKIKDEYDIIDLINRFPYDAKTWWSRQRNTVRPFAGSSMFYVLARLIADGAKHVDLFGVDHDGYGNVDPRTGLVEVSRRVKDWWNDRWKWEQRLLEDVRKEALKNGITILRFTADYDIADAKREAYTDVDGWL